MAKAALLVIFLFNFEHFSNAQNFSAGLRNGIGYTIDGSLSSTHLRTSAGDHLYFLPEVFFGYKTKKRWAFEASCIRPSSHQETWTVTDIFDAPYRTEKDVVTVRNIEFNLSGQYELLAMFRKHHKRFLPFHSLAGLTLTASRVFINIDYYYSDFVREPVPNASYAEKPYWQIWTGISHTLIWDIAPHASALWVVGIYAYPEELLSSAPYFGFYDPSIRCSTSLGVAYRF